MPLQIRRGTEAERQALTSVNGLVIGELLYVTDDQKLYIGNGTTPGGVVATTYNNNDAKAAAGESITTGTHEYITFTYNPVSRTINSTLNLSDYQGSIKASSFKGSLLTDDGSSLSGITLVDATNGSINLDGTVKGNIVPDLNIAYDIGTNLLRFRDLYLSGSTIYLGTAEISSTGGVVNLPPGSTVGGVPIGTGTGSGDGVIEGTNYNISIVGANSTVIVDADQNRFTGTFVGDLSGSVFGQGSSVIVDATNNSIFASEVLTSRLISDTNSLTVNSEDGLGLEADFYVNSFGFGITGTANGPQNGPAVQYKSSRGTFNSPTALQLFDLIGGTTYFGHNGIDYQLSTLIGSFVDPNGSLSGGVVPSKIGLSVFPDNNPLNSKIVSINRNGYLSIGYAITDDAAAHLDINGAMRLAPLSAAPSSPVTGMLAVADGTSWNPTSTGKPTLVCYLATDWVQVAVAP